MTVIDRLKGLAEHGWLSKAEAETVRSAIAELSALRKEGEAVLMKRPAVFRVQRSPGLFDYYLVEEQAQKHADALGTGYDGLYLRDGTPLYAHPSPAVPERKEGEAVCKCIIVQSGKIAVVCPIHYARIKEEIAAAHPSPAVPEGWRDISTAPKGKKVIVFGEVPGMMHPQTVVARYWTRHTLPVAEGLEEEDRVDISSSGDAYMPEGWYEETMGEDAPAVNLKPTHWQPLPSPPYKG